MHREASTPRPGWQHKLEQLGFDYYNMEGKAYWTEQACYVFTADEIDQLEAATVELHGLCLKAVEYVGRQQALAAHAHPAGLGRLHRAGVAARRSDSVGRFDLAYDGKGPPKLLEYNADTPTALYEAAVVQWYWLKDTKPDADQFNLDPREADRGVARDPGQAAAGSPGRTSRASRTIPRISRRRNTCATPPCRRASPASRSPCTWSAGTAALHRTGEMPIQVMASSIPWEWMVREEFGAHVLTDTTAFIEPAWKMILRTRCCCRSSGRASPATPICCRPSKPSTPTSAARM